VAKKKQKKFGICCVCGNPLTEYHLSNGVIKVCSFKCQDEYILKNKSSEQSDARS